MTLNFSDHIAQKLMYKEANDIKDPKIKFNQLDVIDKNIINFCNTPQTDSHIKQFFVSRDEDGHTINFDEKIQFLKNEGFLDHAYTKYVVNPKYREFTTVIPMTAGKEDMEYLSTVDAIIEDINKFEIGGLADTQIIDKLVEKYELSEKNAYDILRSTKHFSKDIKEVDADYAQTSNGDLGVGLIDRTEREEQRESLIGPKVSFNLKKKSSREIVESDKQSILKKAYSYLTTVNKPSVNKSNIHFEAVNYVRKFLANYRFPLSPTIKFNAIKSAAFNSDNKLNGEVNISVEFKTLSNLKKRADISLPIVNGSFIEPSTITVDGQAFIISQSAVDTITKGATIYNQANPRKNFLANPVDRIIEDKYKDKKVPQIKKDMFSI